MLLPFGRNNLVIIGYIFDAVMLMHKRCTQIKFIGPYLNKNSYFACSSMPVLLANPSLKAGALPHCFPPLSAVLLAVCLTHLGPNPSLNPDGFFCFFA